MGSCASLFSRDGRRVYRYWNRWYARDVVALEEKVAASLSRVPADRFRPDAPCCAQDYMDLVGLDMVSKRAKKIDWCFKCGAPHPV